MFVCCKAGLCPSPFGRGWRVPATPGGEGVEFTKGLESSPGQYTRIPVDRWFSTPSPGGKILPPSRREGQIGTQDSIMEPSREIALDCPAKVNLSLSIGSKPLANGFHPLASWMVAVQFADHHCALAASTDGYAKSLSSPRLTRRRLRFPVRSIGPLNKDLVLPCSWICSKPSASAGRVSHKRDAVEAASPPALAWAAAP